MICGTRDIFKLARCAHGSLARLRAHIGGANKLLDFPAAVAEQEHLRLQAEWLWAALATVAPRKAGSERISRSAMPNHDVMDMTGPNDVGWGQNRKNSR
jgi:hypothetical protein